MPLFPWRHLQEGSVGTVYSENGRLQPIPLCIHRFSRFMNQISAKNVDIFRARYPQGNVDISWNLPQNATVYSVNDLNHNNKNATQRVITLYTGYFPTVYSRNLF